MRGTVTQKVKGGPWYVVIDLGRDLVTNKRRQKWHSGFRTRKAAETELTKLLRQLQTGEYVEPSHLTLGEYLRKWLTNYALQAVSGKTFERYEQIVEKAIIPALGSIPLPRIQPLQIQNFYAAQMASGRKKPTKAEDSPKGLMPQTVLHYHRLLHKALAQAVRWNLLVANPADRVEPPKVRAQEIQPIDEVRSAWLIELAEGTRCYIPIVLAIYTGMRRGEILALRWQEVDLEGGYLKVVRAIEQTKKFGIVFKEPKSKKGWRVLSLPAKVVGILTAHRAAQNERKAILGPGYEENDLVCCCEDGTVWKPTAFDSTYRQLLKRRKLDGPTFHALRHSHASHLLRSGVDPKVISERLGHSKVAFTLDQYVHLMPGMQEEASDRIEKAMNKAFDQIHPTSRVI
jgi:integrase